jgi:hypothetical protein
MSRIRIEDLTVVEGLATEEEALIFGAGRRSFRPTIEALETRELMDAGIGQAVLPPPPPMAMPGAWTAAQYQAQANDGQTVAMHHGPDVEAQQPNAGIEAGYDATLPDNVAVAQPNRVFAVGAGLQTGTTDWGLGAAQALGPASGPRVLTLGANDSNRLADLAPDADAEPQALAPSPAVGALMDPLPACKTATLPFAWRAAFTKAIENATPSSMTLGGVEYQRTSVALGEFKLPYNLGWIEGNVRLNYEGPHGNVQTIDIRINNGNVSFSYSPHFAQFARSKLWLDFSSVWINQGSVWLWSQNWRNGFSNKEFYGHSMTSLNQAIREGVDNAQGWCQPVRAPARPAPVLPPVPAPAR